MWPEGNLRRLGMGNEFLPFKKIEDGLDLREDWFRQAPVPLSVTMESGTFDR